MICTWHAILTRTHAHAPPAHAYFFFFGTARTVVTIKTDESGKPLAIEDVKQKPVPTIEFPMPEDASSSSPSPGKPAYSTPLSSPSFTLPWPCLLSS